MDGPTLYEQEGTPLIQNEKPVDNEFEAQQHASPSQRRFGYILIAIAALCQSIRATGLHAIFNYTPIPMSLSFMSMGVTFNVLAVLAMWIYKVNPMPLLNNRKMLMIWIFRALSVSFLKYFNLLTLQNIAVGTALTLFSTSPSMGSVFAWLFLGDHITFIDVGILIGNIVGVILIASPFTSGSTQDVDLISSKMSPQIGIAAGILCALFMAATVTMEKSLSSRIHFLLVLLAIGVGATFTTFILIDHEALVIMVNYPKAMLGLFGVSFLTFITQALLNYAVRFCRTGLVLVVRSLNVPFSFILGYIFLAELPTFVQAAGVLLVLSSLIVIGFH